MVTPYSSAKIPTLASEMVIILPLASVRVAPSFPGCKSVVNLTLSLFLKLPLKNNPVVATTKTTAAAIAIRGHKRTVLTANGCKASLDPIRSSADSI
ncbi:hypothetical protein D3C78_1436420 [compost metagenome]